MSPLAAPETPSTTCAWAQVRVLFDQLVDLTPADRARALAQAHPSTDLEREVCELLAQHDALTELVRQRHEAVEPAKEVADGVA